MKKIIAIMLISMQVLLLASCGGDDEPAEQKETAVATETADAPEEQADDEIDLTKEFSVGKVENNSYKNEFVGIGCDLDSDWIFYTEEELKTLNDSAMDKAGADYEEAIENIEVVYDMYANYLEPPKNISVVLVKADVSELQKTDMTEYYNTSMEKSKEGFTAMGCKDVKCEVINLDIDGVKTDVLKTVADVNGVIMTQLCLSKKCNGYMANITATSFDEQNPEEVFANFYWLK